jgi:hypothetical protein
MTPPTPLIPLRILISNDDGVFAEGIQSLAAEAHLRGHRVTVVCPDQERSATGHGLTLQTPIRAERADELFAEGVTAWACSGTPSDCVKLALFRLLDEPPDLVLSGINHGPNLGTDVLYSGTVSAAMEGTIEGLPALAVSSADFQWRQFEPAARLALDVAEHRFHAPKAAPGEHGGLEALCLICLDHRFGRRDHRLGLRRLHAGGGQRGGHCSHEDARARHQPRPETLAAGAAATRASSATSVLAMAAEPGMTPSSNERTRSRLKKVILGSPTW